MHQQPFQFSYTVYDSSAELNVDDQRLLQAALNATELSYAPYSKFKVGAAALLSNRQIVEGGNQENASFPAGLCAEGVVMAAASSQYPGIPINTLAVTYRSSLTECDHPIAPCGICRQSLQEFSQRTNGTIRLILGGEKGKVFVIDDANALLPLGFTF